MEEKPPRKLIRSDSDVQKRRAARDNAQKNVGPPSARKTGTKKRTVSLPFVGLLHGNPSSVFKKPSSEEKMDSYADDSVSRMQKEKELMGGIGSFLDDARRTNQVGMRPELSNHSLDTFDIRSGFYTETPAPTHHVDERDFEDHHTFQDYPRPSPNRHMTHHNPEEVQAERRHMRHLDDLTEESDMEVTERKRNKRSGSSDGGLVDDVMAAVRNQDSDSVSSSDEESSSDVRKGQRNSNVRFAIGGQMLGDPGVDGDEDGGASEPSVSITLGSEPTSEEGADKNSADQLDKEGRRRTVSSEAGGGEGKGKKKRREDRSHSTSTAPKGELLGEKRHIGSEVQFLDKDLITKFRREREEARHLNEPQAATLASHRLGQYSGGRHSRVSGFPVGSKNVSPPTAIVHIGMPGEKTAGKHYDHSPHELFVELDELYLGDDHQYEWREKARWIKFEEDVEEGAGRFGKPHVASLSFLSLLELRRCLEHGALLLDLEVNDLPELVNSIINELLLEDQLHPQEKDLVRETLLLKHRGNHEHKGGVIKLLQTNLTVPNFASFQHRPALHRHSSHVEKSSSVNNWSNSMNEVKRPKPQESVVSFNEAKISMVNPMMEKKKLPKHQLHENGTDGSLGVPNGTNGTAKDSNTSITDTEKNNHINHGYEDDGPDMSRLKKKPVITFAPNQDLWTQTRDRKVSHVHIDINSPPGGEDEKETDDPNPSKTNLQRRGSNILHKIPKGAEATTVLVGPISALSQPVMAFVRLAVGTYFDDLTEVNLPVRFLFVLMGPPNAGLDYHEIGRSISTLMANNLFNEVAYRASSRRELLEAINGFLGDSIVLPPGKWDKDTLLPIISMERKKQVLREKRREMTQRCSEGDTVQDDEPDKPPEDNPLVRTGRLFGGLVNDIKRRYPHYKSDFTDALNMQCLAAIFFIYFACLSPAITFGGLMSEATDQWMGVSELLISTCICGVLFSLLSGQPLNILGFTGPLLVFEAALYQMSESLGVEYIVFRVWVCIWLSIITVVVVMFEGSVMVRYFTLFSEDIFALLIALIFIISVFEKLAKIFQDHPLKDSYHIIHIGPPNRTDTPVLDNLTDSIWTQMNDTGMGMTNSTMPTPTTLAPFEEFDIEHEEPNTALLSLILCMGTFMMAYGLKIFRNSQFLGRTARRAIGDFGIPLSILLMVMIDFLIHETYTEKLYVPDGLSPTKGREYRGWFINPTGIKKSLPIWAYFGAVIPALLVFILVFMESQITGLIVNKPERNLKKGSGYHIDLLLIGGYAFIGGLMGIPMHCAATVRSVAHCSALSVFSRTHAPGEKPVLEETKEQRVTNLAVHILIGLSVLLGPVLRHVPLPVLFGVFLYMGVASLNGIQLVDRCYLLFMPKKHHPQVGYVRRVKTFRMHLYTIIQLLCLAILWIVKSTDGALAFSFILILFVPLRRYVLPRIFTEKELVYLDHGEGADKLDDDEEEEADFYKQSHTTPATAVSTKSKEN